MIKAIAVDDEPMALEIIEIHAQKVPFMQLEAKFINAISALEYLNKNPVDVLFLDIKMPDISGIDFYRSLVNKPYLIFTTAYSEHAVTGFELEAIDYLLKPFTFPRFLKACNKVYDICQPNNSPADHIFLRDGSDLVRIQFADILYIEATGNYVTYILADKQVLTRATIKETIELLPRHNFLQTHRSFIINTHHVSKIERHQVSIKDYKIPIGISYTTDIRTRFT